MKTTIALIMLLLVLLAGCSSGVEEHEIEEAIAKANRCTTDDECSLAGSKCPFGCYVYVHEDEAEHIAHLIDEYESTCVYRCASCLTVACVNNTCVPSC